MGNCHDCFMSGLPQHPFKDHVFLHNWHSQELLKAVIMCSLLKSMHVIQYFHALQLLISSKKGNKLVRDKKCGGQFYLKYKVPCVVACMLEQHAQLLLFARINKLHVVPDNFATFIYAFTFEHSWEHPINCN